MTEPSRCPVCGTAWDPPSWERLAAHLVEQAGASEDRHVMWLNRTVTKFATDAGHLVPLLQAALGGGSADDAVRVRR